MARVERKFRRLHRILISSECEIAMQLCGALLLLFIVMFIVIVNWLLIVVYGDL